MVGLTAPGPTPGGLYGGNSGGAKDHNVNVSGQTPSENYLMNPGASFTFAEASGRGSPLPVFRPLNWAYLHDRIALNSQVTGLYPAPVLDSVSSPVAFGGGPTTSITLLGSGFVDPEVKLWGASPVPLQVFNIVTDPSGESLTATLSSFFSPPGVYDVELINSDGQSSRLDAALEVLP
jgi:hypothetical protein